MKKEIVINASKDRSRIAIVEDGQLAELYIENPDNVRTLGNIYLARVRKIMPSLRAAFVDIGQRQDAFLHYSDLTDNLAALQVIAGEQVPGGAKVLSTAPAKRVADDENEPDPSEKLELGDTTDAAEAPDTEAEAEATDAAPAAARSRGRRTSRGRGRSGGGRRSEEEEQEETPKKRRSYVIDLTHRPGRVEAPIRPAPAPPAAPPPPVAEPLTAIAPEVMVPEVPEPEALETREIDNAVAAPAPEARTRGRRRPAADAPDADAPEAVATDGETEEAPKKPARRSRRKADAPADETSTTDATATDTPADEAVEAPARSRSRRKKVAPEAEAPEAETNPEGTEEKAPARRGRRTRPTADAEAPAETAADTGAAVEPDEDVERIEAVPAHQPLAHPPADDAEATGDDATDAEGDDETAEGDDATRRRRRGRRGGRRRRKSGADGEAEGDGAEADAEQTTADVAPVPTAETEESFQIKEGRGRRGRRGAAPADESGDAPAAAAEAPAENRERQPRESRERQPRESRERQPRETTGREGSGREAAPAREAAPVKPAPTRADAEAARPYTGRLEDLLRRDGRVIVKITKEPISAKGSRVSTDVSLAGRFLVLVPAADYVAVSKKIASAKERRRLRTLAESLKPEGFGVIVRTVAEDRDAKALDTDLRLLLEKWRKIEAQIRGAGANPALLYEDVNMVSSIIRDLFTEDYDRILVDDPKVHRNLKAYVQAVAPHMAERVVLHKSNIPVFRAAGIEKQVEEAFSVRVSLPTGGYLIIEHTEAMHVVDVNSGRAGRGLSQNENLLRVNLEAAKEVARQLRLRDLGGIIVVDFIDMYAEADRRKIYNALKDEFRKDRAVTKLLPMSDFGIVQITRQRLRPSLMQKADKLSESEVAPVMGDGGDGGDGAAPTPRSAWRPSARARSSSPTGATRSSAARRP